ncbi:hypothetical protein [Candidatus Burkholderia verschuerenii]|uniref:hypothetical protein n=1 Tax=Candidatus Burkholderia verschuerenii TaxID=242163 RepID=UPI00067B87C0|nr:hypothetical protein [Candidatus Burkholderia verschuerenii]
MMAGTKHTKEPGELELNDGQQEQVAAYLAMRRFKQRRYPWVLAGVAFGAVALLVLQQFAATIERDAAGAAWSSPLPGVAKAIGAGAFVLSLVVAFIYVTRIERVLRKARDVLRRAGLPDDFISSLDRINLTELDRALTERAEADRAHKEG